MKNVQQKLQKLIKQKLQRFKGQVINRDQLSQNGIVANMIRKNEKNNQQKQDQNDKANTKTYEQIIRVLNIQKQKGFVNIIQHLKFSQNIKQTLQTTKTPFQHQLIQILNSLSSQILDYNRFHMSFSNILSQYSVQQSQYFTYQSQYRYKQDEIQQIKQQIQNYTNKNVNIMDQYEEYQGKISYFQNIINMMKKIKQQIIMKNNNHDEVFNQNEGNNKYKYNNNKMNDNNSHKMNDKDKVIFKIILSICILYRISQPQSNQFTLLRKILSQPSSSTQSSSLSSTQSSSLSSTQSQSLSRFSRLYMSALPLYNQLTHLLLLQQYTLFKYFYYNNSFASILNYLILQYCEIYCVCIDPQNSLFGYLLEYAELSQHNNNNKQVHHIQGDNANVEDLKYYLSVPGYVIINQPSDQLTNEIMAIVQYKYDMTKISNNNYTNNNSKKTSYVFGQLSIHQQTKIIFTYCDIDSVHPHIIHNTDYVINFQQTQSNLLSIYTRKLTQLQSNQSLNKKSVLSSYLQKIKQYENLDQKIQNAIIKSKKDNNSQLEIEEKVKKIEEIKREVFREIKEKEKLLEEICYGNYNSNNNHTTNNNNGISILLQHKLNNYQQINLLVDFTLNNKISSKLLLQFVEYIHLRMKNIKISISVRQAVKILQRIIIKKSNFKTNKVNKSMKSIKEITPQTKFKLLSKKQIQCSKQQQQIRPFKQQIQQQLSSVMTTDNFLFFLQHILHSHSIISTSQPRILKKYLLSLSLNYNLPLSQKRIVDFNSFLMGPEVSYVIEIKNYKQWQGIQTIFNSIKQKKLLMKIIIICPNDIKIDSKIINQFKIIHIQDVMKNLVRLMYEKQSEKQKQSKNIKTTTIQQNNQNLEAYNNALKQDKQISNLEKFNRFQLNLMK